MNSKEAFALTAAIGFGLGLAGTAGGRRPPPAPKPAPKPKRSLKRKRQKRYHLPSWFWVSVASGLPKYVVSSPDGIEFDVSEELLDPDSWDEFRSVGEGQINPKTGDVIFHNWNGTVPSARVGRRIRRVLVLA